MAEKKIPAPSQQQIAGLSRSNGALVLVFNTSKGKWELLDKAQGDKVVTNDPNGYVTYASWQGGKNTVKEETKKEVKPTGYQGSVTDRVATENAIASAKITFDASGPIITYESPNEADPKGGPSVYTTYLYVDDKGGVSLSPDDARKGIVTNKQFTFDKTDAARDKHLADLYKIYNNKQAIIDRLYQAGYLTTNKNVPTDAMLAALDQAAAQYTVDQVEAYKSGQIKEFSTLNDWLGTQQGKAESKAGTRSVPNITEFSDTDARALIDDVVNSLMLRKPTDQEYAKLVPLIQRKQRQNPAITSTTTDAEGRVVSTKTKTGINEQQFLIEKLSKRDEAKANMIMGFYDAFKQAIGVR